MIGMLGVGSNGGKVDGGIFGVGKSVGKVDGGRCMVTCF